MSIQDEAKPEAAPATPVSDTDREARVKRLILAAELIESGEPYDAIVVGAMLRTAAKTAASQPVQVEVTDDHRAMLARSIGNWDERLVRKYNEAAYKYMAEMAAALGGGE